MSDIAANSDERARPLSVHDAGSGAVLLRVETCCVMGLQLVRDAKGAVVAALGPVAADDPETLVVYSPQPIYANQTPNAMVSTELGQPLFVWFTQQVTFEAETPRGRGRWGVFAGMLHIVKPPPDETPLLIFGPSGGSGCGTGFRCGDSSGDGASVSGIPSTVVVAPRRLSSHTWSVIIPEDAVDGGSSTLALLTPSTALGGAERAPSYTYECREKNRHFHFKDGGGGQREVMRLKPQKLKTNPLALCHDVVVAEGVDAALMICAVAGHMRLEAALRRRATPHIWNAASPSA